MSACKSIHNKWGVMMALALVVMLLRSPSLEEPFDNDSGANAYHARLILRGEPLYGSHHPAHHLPAVYYTYALAFFVFGDSVFSVKLLLIIWTIVTACLIYRLGLRMRNKMVGLLAAVFYALLSSDVGLMGQTAESELFANLPRVAAVLVIAYLLDRPNPSWEFAIVGALAGIAFLFKAVYLSPLVIAGLALLLDAWKDGPRAGTWQSTLRRGIWTLGGFAAVLLVVVAYFGFLGLLPRFLLVFKIGKDYVQFRNATVTPWAMVVYPVAVLGYTNAALLVYSISGLLQHTIAGLRHGWRRLGEGGNASFYVATWYVLSFAEAGATRVAFSHYYLLMVPPLALMAASFLGDIYEEIRLRASGTARVITNSTLAFLVGIGLFLSGTGNFDYYHHYARYRLGLEAHEEFVLKAVSWGSSLVRVQRLADYVKVHTTPGDRIYYWSGDTQIYYLADRRCAIDMIWPLYAEASGSHERIFSSQTKYIILGESNNIPRSGWLYEQLDGEYSLERVIDDQEIYRRVDS